MRGVSCTAANACTAVGSYLNGSSTRTLAERWNGASWTVQSTPNPTGSQYAVFQGVSCSSATSCMAVGRFFDTPNSKYSTLAEQWNGSNWAIKTPQSVPGQTFSTLDGVSCTSSTACAAVGGYSTNTNASQADKLLAEGWNGTSWSIEGTPPPPSATFATFSGVSCHAAGECTAAGGSSTTPGATSPSTPLAERWNGTSWAIQGTLTATSQGFNGDSCPGASACTAVGGFGGMFAERWDGTSWTSQTLASVSPNAGQLLGVSCPTAAACTATGQSLSNYFVQAQWSSTIFIGVMDVPLAERWH